MRRATRAGESADVCLTMDAEQLAQVDPQQLAQRVRPNSFHCESHQFLKHPWISWLADAAAAAASYDATADELPPQGLL